MIEASHIDPIQHESGLVAKFYYDQDARNPRNEFDSIGHMVLADWKDLKPWPGSVKGASNYAPDDIVQVMVDLCEYTDERWEDKVRNREVDFSFIQRRALRRGYIVLPVYKYDHSGVMYNTTGFSCPWDSGMVGVIFAAYTLINREYSTTPSNIRKALVSEVSEFSAWSNGDVYGYRIEDTEGYEYDGADDTSCWGYYDTDDNKILIADAKDALDGL